MQSTQTKKIHHTAKPSQSAMQTPLQNAPPASKRLITSDFGPVGTVPALLVATLILVAVLIALTSGAAVFNSLAISFSALVWTCIVALIVRYVRHHTHRTFGYANLVTTLRAVSTAVLAGCIPIAAIIVSTATVADSGSLSNAATNDPAIWAWVLAISASLTLCLDGLDGYLARRDNNCSAFGARFDMETDALLALIIALILWQSGKVGIWVLGLGSLRYAFLAASLRYDALRADLFASMRRKVVCVIQVGALCLMVYPFVTSDVASVLGAIALVCLIYSFAVDTIWLVKHESKQRTATS